jgi:hypothetical protein
MLITKNDVFDKLQQFLYHNISLEALVEWAETAMMEHEFDEVDLAVIRNIISRIGLADVKAYGLTWDECESFIAELGYKVKLNFEYA